MKVVSAQTMALMESEAYKQGFRELDFMENAGYGIARAVQGFIEENGLGKDVLLLCGKGNNAGDAFVAGRFLINQGFNVFALQPEPVQVCSPLCQINRSIFEEHEGKIFMSFEECPSFDLIIDGLFGTGFKGVVKEPYASLIQQANDSRIPILSIDIPSGLDGTTGRVEGPVIHAADTLFLGLPKTGFFLEDGWNVVGQLTAVGFGLPRAIVDKTRAVFEMLTAIPMGYLLPLIERNRHKYQAGYVIGLAGSPSMPGASLLSSLAAFRGGSGMVKLLHPQGMEAELANSPYELIKLPYDAKKPQEVLEWLEKANSTFIGPGLGRTEEVRQLLKSTIPKLTKPCVMDADALYFLAEDDFKLPSEVILTPHMGEMQKLLHSKIPLVLNEALLETCQNYVEEKGVTLVLKGAPTFIFHPGSTILVNPTGDPGMATAGSGDVLTGLIASLLSQGLGCRDAAALGVYLHGLSGEYAAEEHTSRGVMALDLIEQFAEAYKILGVFS